MNLLISTIEIGCILSFASLAALLTFRFAGFPDLSVDGVVTLGAVVFVKLYSCGIPLFACIVLSVFAGALAGLVTAALSEKLKINPLLASVLMLIMLYSLNLRILGRPNQAIFDLNLAIFDNHLLTAISLLALVIVSTVALWLFFRSELGAAFRVVGSCPRFLSSVGRNPFNLRLLLVSFASAMVALSGCMLAISYKYADVSMGFGTLIIAIASLIIGENICGRFPILNQLAAVFVGTLSYEIAVSIALSLGMSPIDVKLATGLIAILLLGLSRKKGGLLATEST